MRAQFVKDFFRLERRHKRLDQDRRANASAREFQFVLGEIVADAEVLNENSEFTLYLIDKSGEEHVAQGKLQWV